MKCELKYRPVISATPERDRIAVKEAYLTGDGFCPACKREGRQTPIEERFGESVCESDGAYLVCVGEDETIYHAASLDD